MYLEKKKIGNNVYNYLKESKRVNGKVTTRTVAYLGKGNITKKELIKKIQQAECEINNEFLNKDEILEVNNLKKDFQKKLKALDRKLLTDMFKDFKTHYIYNTNAIEGNSLTLEETNLLLNENMSPDGKDLREIYDHINEKETFDFILKEKPEISNELIITIHSMLLKGIDERIGRFREHNVRVFGASFETTPAKYVLTDMNLLIKWYNKRKKSIHPLILSAIFHEKFERIHPFYDGNGRTGRMLSNLILLGNKLPPLIIKSKDRKEYYSVLSSAHKADLFGENVKKYKPIALFFYQQLKLTYESIFSKWG